MDKIKEIAEAHWEWLEPLLAPYYAPKTLATLKYLYITAMMYGWKHKEEEL